jgi:hypothetical protein
VASGAVAARPAGRPGAPGRRDGAAMVGKGTYGRASASARRAAFGGGGADWKRSRLKRPPTGSPGPALAAVVPGPTASQVSAHEGERCRVRLGAPSARRAAFGGGGADWKRSRFKRPPTGSPGPALAAVLPGPTASQVSAHEGERCRVRLGAPSARRAAFGGGGADWKRSRLRRPTTALRAAVPPGAPGRPWRLWFPGQRLRRSRLVKARAVGCAWAHRHELNRPELGPGQVPSPLRRGRGRPGRRLRTGRGRGRSRGARGGSRCRRWGWARPRSGSSPGRGGP